MAAQMTRLKGSTMRSVLSVAALALLAACAPPPHLQPQGGVGFGDNPGYAPAVGAIPAAPSTVPGASGISSSELNTALYGTAAPAGSAASAVPSPAYPLPAAPQPVAPQPAAVAGAIPSVAPQPGTLGISDEQDFTAVAARETIETDKQRIEANKAQYQQIAPTALPERDAAAAVSPVIQYVLSAPNRLGEPIYQRRAVKPDAHLKACQRFATEEAAQEAFLKAGGPTRDTKKLDPDGDGFACKFDPTPFQKARG